MQNPFQTPADTDAHMMDVGEAAETIVEEQKARSWIGNGTLAPTSFEPRTAPSKFHRAKNRLCWKSSPTRRR